MQSPLSKKEKVGAYSAVEIDANRSDTETSNRSISPVPGWPTGPQRIARAPIWIFADVLLLLFPIAFIALAALAYRLDGKELSSRGKHIQEAILLGPTLFPLAFAALAGRSLKRIALWRAERGTTLGFLEHLIGSQSLVATLGHAITLHSLNFITFGLLVLWALSPLGGQSALRLLDQANSTVIESHHVYYASIDASSEFPRRSYNEDAANRVNAVVSSALMTADNLEQSPIDTWNHPKIPRLEELEQAENNNNTERPWYNVDPRANHSYASLTGVDVINLSHVGATNFSVPYEYMYFGCELSPENNLNTDVKSPMFGQPNSTSQLKYLNNIRSTNASIPDAVYLESGDQFPINGTAMSLINYRSFFIYAKSTAKKPVTLLYGSKVFGLNFFLFECSMKSVQIEANIVCASDTCGVQRLRRLDRPRKSRSGLYLPYDVINDGTTTRYFIRHLSKMGGANNTLDRPNPIDQYLYGVRPWGSDDITGRAPMQNWTSYVGAPEKTNEMSHRFTRFLNTYWDASRWPLAITRNDPFGENSINKTTNAPPAILTMNKTEAVITRQIPIYRASGTWVALLVVCSCVLLLLGIFSAVLALHVSVPDVFDYVSSFTRDNPHVRAPAGGSGMDGAERARLLRKSPVQLGDVDGDGETGYIALRSVDGVEDCRVGRVTRDRMYR